ncbi:MAG: hypothetical protein GF383_13845 [Candidatus Lokiarchaeota archaeon]|nr:hypothetical protein [Candidatus Lokiarchaeota archaeon]MBD3342387.1 hypothetical protein [Candidatus Lokiarchaeota archaeon]
MLRFSVLKIIGTSIFFFLLALTGSIFFTILGFAWLMFFNGYSIFMFPLLHLSIDQDETIHKTRREGMFFGIQALFNKPAVSVGPIIATVILVSFGFIQGSETQPESALFGIALLFLVYPVIMTAISVIFIYFYPLSDEVLKEIQIKLEKIHKEKLEVSKKS